MIKNFCYLLFLLTLFSACESGNKSINPKLRDFRFEPVKGIRYTEVRRRFSNGLSFNAEGFMQKPSWIIEVVKEDTMSAWSPQKNRMQKFYLQFDHGNLYNFAEEWFKVKHISRDSLVFQRVQVNNKIIAQDFRSDVNMTFYAQNYIKNKLKAVAEQLQKPTKADTAFIRKRSAEVNTSSDSSFAATEPVTFIPKSKIVTVKKFEQPGDKLSGRTVSYNYMFPEYRIEINRAYRDFVYQFTAIVDFNGNIHVKSLNGILPEDMEQKIKVVQGIADIYIRNLFTIKAGTTLGIPHNSQISVGVVGKAIKKP
ncbi:hypothetical protein [Pedobacter jamesrossensis]|uniref:DUF4136 domain-containing protein n=1 Tax=Pedobacter jamesrossensis TaxID=1908238 RepID=A0ABV8NQV8_9SPHI